MYHVVEHRAYKTISVVEHLYFEKSKQHKFLLICSTGETLPDSYHGENSDILDHWVFKSTIMSTDNKEEAIEQMLLEGLAL